MHRLLSILIALALMPVGARAADMALVNLSVASMRAEPRYSSELVSQVVMGTPVKLIQREGEWWQVESPEGYRGWVRRGSLTPADSQRMEDWSTCPRMIYTSVTQGTVYTQATGLSARDVVCDLVLGCIVECDGSCISGNRMKITLPDGKQGWTDCHCLQALDDWAAQPFDPDLILSCACSMMGTPYLWGGASTKGCDCSGLVKVCYFANGYILMRDASQQARTGTNMDTDHSRYHRGDLVFFSGSERSNRVTHVGIYDADGWFVHCAGRVRRNNLDSSSPDADPDHWLLSATRIGGMEGTPGIVRAASHPWYFKQ